MKTATSYGGYSADLQQEIQDLNPSVLVYVLDDLAILREMIFPEITTGPASNALQKQEIRNKFTNRLNQCEEKATDLADLLDEYGHNAFTGSSAYLLLHQSSCCMALLADCLAPTVELSEDPRHPDRWFSDGARDILADVAEEGRKALQSALAQLGVTPPPEQEAASFVLVDELAKLEEGEMAEVLKHAEDYYHMRFGDEACDLKRQIFEPLEEALARLKPHDFTLYRATARSLAKLEVESYRLGQANHFLGIAAEQTVPGENRIHRLRSEIPAEELGPYA
ncbi:MAG: hypothetical protein U5J62_06425 [Desulfurivibrio sp.]|nr:hypothetical protein [Desulfurivibrio sp.]